MDVLQDGDCQLVVRVWRATSEDGQIDVMLGYSPSEGGIYSFRRSRRNSRKYDSFGRGRTGYCAFYVFWMVFVAVTPLEGVGQMQ